VSQDHAPHAFAPSECLRCGHDLREHIASAINEAFDAVFAIPTEDIDQDGRVRPSDPVGVKDAALGAVMRLRWALVAEETP